MKTFYGSLLIILMLIQVSGCDGKRGSGKESQSAADRTTVKDTGYTGIKKYFSNQSLVKEITFENGVREGVMKSFYASGKLRQTFWYEKGLREDSAVWYYEEGQVFRITPYKRDTIDGIQKQYYRNGRLKAKLIYKKGMRTPFLEEYTTDGKLVQGYPDILVTTRDNYSSSGTYTVDLQLSDESTKVRYFRGEFSGGVFDSTQCSRIKTLKGTGTLHLKKTGSPGPVYIGVIAEIMTGFGNNYFVFKKITVPYNDLN